MTRGHEPTPTGPGREPSDAHRSSGAAAGRPVEYRLRRALDARAAGITVRELRPAQPPGAGARRLPWAWPRGFTLPLAGLAAAAAVVAGYAVLAPDAPVRPGPVPAPPAAPPSSSPTGTAPGPDPDGDPSVSPSPSAAPSAYPSRRPPSPSTSYVPTVGPSRAPGAGTGSPRPSPASSPSSAPTATASPPTPSVSSRPPTASPTMR
ncbi:hypothetical protein [Streptomyces sp. NPDC002104]